ncbi:hypothetical protein BV22DRAFT_1041759 [Leucogyrophana mollusca]|uniref:Uncharacterized protein n=1 Tax=Leucogyrophana mollusca TaxID=85980 RepID=A0ACB8AYT5_9AGAM|nr:hypothetical protein BV22DRAFT_1041759 [Leucogyrophana mollusca]
MPPRTAHVRQPLVWNHLLACLIHPHERGWWSHGGGRAGYVSPVYFGSKGSRCFH